MRRAASIGVLAGSALVVALGCADRGITQPEPQVVEEVVFDASLGVELAQMTRTASGLYYQDTEPGDGPPAEVGDSVRVRFAGFLTNGFSFGSGLVPPYVVGQGNLIPGFAEAVRGIREGGTRKAVIPPDLGYGPQPNGSIPGGSVLIFDITLVEVVEGPF